MRLAEMEAIALNVGLAIFAAFIFFIIYDLAKNLTRVSSAPSSCFLRWVWVWLRFWLKPLSLR